MNHTERIAKIARRHRYVTRRLAKEAIETYLKLLTEEFLRVSGWKFMRLAKLKRALRAIAERKDYTPITAYGQKSA